MHTDKPLRVLIAENHRDLSDLMSQLVDAEPDMCCVGQVTSAPDVVAAAQQTAADALVLDLTLHGGSGMSLIEELVHSVPGLRVIIFSGYCNDELARESRRRGAAAFVPKGSDFNVLLDEIRAAGQPQHAVHSSASADS